MSSSQSKKRSAPPSHHNQSRKSKIAFEIIFENSPIEIANDELRFWRDSYLHIHSLLLSKNNLSDMTKVIQQELIKNENGGNEQLPLYVKIQMGLFYSCVVCEDQKLGDLMNLVQLVNQDQFGCFLEKLNVVLFCSQKVKEIYIPRLIDIVKALMDVCMEKLETTILLLLRNFYLTENDAAKFNYIVKFFSLVEKKKNLIAEKSNNSLSFIFYKAMRLLSVTMMHKECKDLQKLLVGYVKWVWEEHKKSALALGREFMRISQELFKMEELSFLVEELKAKNENSGKKLFRELVKDTFCTKKLKPETLILVQIPPFLEQYTMFLLNSGTKSTFNRHLIWLTSRLSIKKKTISESLLVDYIRYLLISVEDPQSPQTPLKKSERVHRWLILGWLFKYIKSEIYRTLAKQSLFFDWIYFEGENEARMYKIFEPCWLMIINSMNKYKEMSEELLEFLFLYAKEYDSNNKKSEQNIMKIFSLFKKKNMGNLEILLESSYVTPYLKNRLKSLVQSSKNKNFENLKKDEKSEKSENFDFEEKNEEKSMVLEQGYNHEYYPVNNIFEKEKPYRISTRGLRLEKMGDSVPLFIRELPSYASFKENASFANLSILMNEIFLKGASLATQAYSPTVIDQLSQEQIITHTATFIITLFSDFLDQKFQIEESKSFEQISTKILSRNFDYEKEQPVLMGLSFFLFIKLSKVFNESLSYYYIMEKLMAQIFEREGIIHFEFVLILCLVRWREKMKKKGKSYSRLRDLKGLMGLKVVLVGVQFDKMSDIFYKCCSQVAKADELIQSTLKFMYFNFGEDMLIEIIDTYSLLLAKDDRKYIKHIIIFLLKIFNMKIAFKLEIKNCIQLGVSYKKNLQSLIFECCSKNLNIQMNFWTLHSIITETENDSIVEFSCEKLKEVLNNLSNLNRKKNDLKAFLWGFKDYFMKKYLRIEDEKILIKCLNHIIGINSAFEEFVFLLFKPLKDKIIQKSLRIYLKDISANEDHESVLNLTEHLAFWKERNFIKVGNNPKHFALDFLIMKQLDNCVDELGLNKDILNKLQTN